VIKLRLPIHPVFAFLLILAISFAASIILKFTWYDRLGPGEMYLTDQTRRAET
jgi:hypothetical protein